MVLRETLPPFAGNAKLHPSDIILETPERKPTCLIFSFFVSEKMNGSSPHL